MIGHAPTQRRHPSLPPDRRRPEALPVHPGGPFWAKNDDGAGSIPAKTQSRHRARRPLAGILPCVEDAVHGPNAQRAVVDRWLGEGVKSTQRGLSEI